MQNSLLRIMLILLFFALLIFATVHSTTVYAQNQNEMNQQAARDFEKADIALNKVYNQLAMKLDRESKTKLKSAQRAWIQFRDAEAQFEADLDARGGSLAPLIYNGRRAEFTKIRMKELQRLLKDNVSEPKQ